MSDSYCVGTLIGFVSGVLSSALAAYCWELRTRRRLFSEATRLEGKLIAHDMLDGRTVNRSKPMDKAWPTVMTPRRRWWSADSHILDVSADHISDDGRVRHLEGYLIIDRASPLLATRIVLYTDSDEVSEQRIVISLNRDTLHVFPVVPPSDSPYHRHALCRQDNRTR
jgi:hypothetical protein